VSMKKQQAAVRLIRIFGACTAGRLLQAAWIDYPALRRPPAIAARGRGAAPFRLASPSEQAPRRARTIDGAAAGATPGTAGCTGGRGATVDRLGLQE
jgi:hypothetical protein